MIATVESEECPNCKSDRVDALVCEDFLDDAEWVEYKCTDCGHTWEEGKDDE